MKEQDLLNKLFTAYIGLKSLGWNDAMYCPKDGTIVELIEVGSTGIHRGYYKGEWPKGGWWVITGNDIYPSYPILFRLIKEENKE